ncbi:MAG: TolC family protein [Planctomycetaceae bacterium]
MKLHVGGMGDGSNSLSCDSDSRPTARARLRDGLLTNMRQSSGVRALLAAGSVCLAATLVLLAVADDLRAVDDIGQAAGNASFIRLQPPQFGHAPPRAELQAPSFYSGKTAASVQRQPQRRDQTTGSGGVNVRTATFQNGTGSTASQPPIRATGHGFTGHGFTWNSPASTTLISPASDDPSIGAENFFSASSDPSQLAVLTTTSAVRGQSQQPTLQEPPPQFSPTYSGRYAPPLLHQRAISHPVAPSSVSSSAVEASSAPGPIRRQPASSQISYGHSVFTAGPGLSRFRATVESDAAMWISPYTQRADAAGDSAVTSVAIPTVPQVPATYSPWWDNAVRSGTGLTSSTLPVDMSMLLQDALLYSPQVLAIKAEPEVLYRVIGQEVANFDWSTFLSGVYSNLNDPVGNTLTLGPNGQTRLLDEKFNFAAGIRQKNLQGGEFSVAQKLGHETQNSQFFVPPHQATARLELSYRQPLLDGAGQAVNQSEIVLARIAANASEDDVVGSLQDHLLKVTETYWTLYRARAEFFQRQKLLQSAQRVLRTLEGRNQVDTVPRQILRAKAAVAQAQSRIQRSFARIRDAESQLRLLVNSPGMLNVGQTELLPLEAPGMVSDPSPLRESLQYALMNRPDISEAIRRMRAAGVRLGVSQNELLPQLDLIVTAYVADLAGFDELGTAYSNQFTDNRPGYTVGLEFEVPIGNRAARARYEQRQWELRRAINVYRATVEKSLTDVEIARREVATAFSEVQSRYQAMSAARDEAEYLQDRFDVLPMVEDSATLLLEDLLAAYERLADEESAFAQALADHAVALVRLKKEQGTLLRSRHSLPDVPESEQRWMDGRLQTVTDGETTILPAEE